jgi:hypothetical protein
MRKNIKKLCVTKWGAVLEVKRMLYSRGGSILSCLVSDPDALDAGQYLPADEIILIATVKKLKDEQDHNDNFMLPNGLSVWGKDRLE